MQMNELRTQIDTVDEQIVDLFRRRMALCADIAQCKKQEKLPVYDPERERKVLQRVSDLAGEELEDYTRVLFSTLFDLSRSYQTRQSTHGAAFMQRVQDAVKNTSFLDRLSRSMLPPIHASSTKAIHGASFVTCRANWEPSSHPASGISA